VQALYACLARALSSVLAGALRALGEPSYPALQRIESSRHQLPNSDHHYAPVYTE
jgi:hypothetical protein